MISVTVVACVIATAVFIWDRWFCRYLIVRSWDQSSVPIGFSHRKGDVTPARIKFSSLPHDRSITGLEQGPVFEDRPPLGMFIDASRIDGAAREFIYLPAASGTAVKFSTPYGEVEPAIITLNHSRPGDKSGLHVVPVNRLKGAVKRRWCHAFVHRPMEGTAGAIYIQPDLGAIDSRIKDGELRLRVIAGAFEARFDLWKEFKFKSIQEMQDWVASGNNSIEIPDWPSGNYWATGYLVNIAPSNKNPLIADIAPITFKVP